MIIIRIIYCNKFNEKCWARFGQTLSKKTEGPICVTYAFKSSLTTDTIFMSNSLSTEAYGPNACGRDVFCNLQEMLMQYKGFAPSSSLKTNIWASCPVGNVCWVSERVCSSCHSVRLICRLRLPVSIWGPDAWRQQPDAVWVTFLRWTSKTKQCLQEWRPLWKLQE